MSATPVFAPPGETRVPTVAELARQHLRPLVRRIDREGHYPAAFLRLLGAAGGFSHHVGEASGLRDAVRSISEVGALCGSTAFLLWSQNSCVWYLTQTENHRLRERYLPSLSRGERLGGTAFSNPIKHLSGIEPLRLTGRRTAGGIVVNGALPWVSNLGEGHVVAIVAQVEGRRVGAFAEVDGEAVRLGPSGHFAALEGTATHSLRFREAFLPEETLLADPVEPFIERIRPGFLLLQLGIAFGVARGAVREMERSANTLGEINRFHPVQPGPLREELEALEAEADELAVTPLSQEAGYLRRVLELRLKAVETVRRASIAALEHAGAPGFLVESAPQRRVREALFFGLLTPSGKQLRKMLEILKTPAARVLK